MVGGFVSLNNFRLISYSHLLGKASYDPKTDKATPQWTVGSNGVSFVLAPQDYAVQYDLNPLYNAGVDGSGQTIAIVNESNINIGLVNSFRSLFGLPYNPPQVIIDGNDPGVDGINNPGGMNGASVEAYLDVEWAGAVAPKAQVDLVIGADTALENGLVLALEHAVYSNVAPIISLSFGECEANLGVSNQFFSNLYEQAAAQGITVLVSTGDSGSAACDSSGAEYATHGPAVSGLASTPFNIGVGGTDFYYSDYNASSTAFNNQLASYWSFTPSNSTPAASILGVIPEQPWNNSQYGMNGFNLYTGTGGFLTTIAGGGGGASSSEQCTYANNSSNTAPARTPAIPSPHGSREPACPATACAICPMSLSLPPTATTTASIPSVTTMAIASRWPAAIPCNSPALAAHRPPPRLCRHHGAGQSEVRTPGTGRLRALSARGPVSHSFHDVTVGTNSVPCDITSTGCIPVSDPAVIAIYRSDGPRRDRRRRSALEPPPPTTPESGYDLATGLGTVDAANLVTNWNKVAFGATKTTLTPSQTNFAHGTAIRSAARSRLPAVRQRAMWR